MNMYCVLDQHAELDFYGVSLLKELSTDRHVAPLGNRTLTPSQPVFLLTAKALRIARSVALTQYGQAGFLFYSMAVPSSRGEFLYVICGRTRHVCGLDPRNHQKCKA